MLVRWNNLQVNISILSDLLGAGFGKEVYILVKCLMCTKRMRKVRTTCYRKILIFSYLMMMTMMMIIVNYSICML